MNGMVVKLVETEEERQAAFAIRMRVFVQEQAVPAEEELDEYDLLPLVSPSKHEPHGPSSVSPDPSRDDADHVIALVDGIAVGTGRVLFLLPAADPGEMPAKKVARIGRMAVDESWRRRGIGSHILRTLEEAASQKGASQAILHAQTYVKEFYAGHGYVEAGEPFLEVGIEHVQMRKRL